MRIDFHKPGWAQRLVKSAIYGLPRAVRKPEPPKETLDEKVDEKAKAVREGKE
jgi:hypothetical protein